MCKYFLLLILLAEYLMCILLLLWPVSFILLIHVLPQVGQKASERKITDLPGLSVYPSEGVLLLLTQA